MSVSRYYAAQFGEGKDETKTQCVVLIEELKLDELKTLLLENVIILNDPLNRSFFDGCYTCRYIYPLSFVPELRFEIDESNYEGRLEKEKEMIRFLVSQGAKIAYDCNICERAGCAPVMQYETRFTRDGVADDGSGSVEKYFEFDDTMDLITACLINYRGDLIEWICEMWPAELKRFNKYHMNAYYWGKFGEETYINYGPLFRTNVDKILRDRVRREMARGVYSMFINGLNLIELESNRIYPVRLRPYSTILTIFLSYDVDILDKLIRGRYINTYIRAGQRGGFLEYVMIADMEEPFRFLVRQRFKFQYDNTMFSFNTPSLHYNEFYFDDDDLYELNMEKKYCRIISDMVKSGEVIDSKLKESDDITSDGIRNLLQERENTFMTYQGLTLDDEIDEGARWEGWDGNFDYHTARARDRKEKRNLRDEPDVMVSNKKEKRRRARIRNRKNSKLN